MSINKEYIKEENQDGAKYYKRKENNHGKSRYFQINSNIDADWREIIISKHQNGSIEIINVMPPRSEYNENEIYVPFNERITSAIQSRTAIGVTDASAKHGQMGGYWIFTSTTKAFEIKNTLYHKYWAENTCVGAEAIVLLELIHMIEKKGRDITRGLITIGIDNRKVHRKLVEDIMKTSMHVQDAGAIVAQIRRLLSRIKFEVQIKLIKGHPKQQAPFERRPLECLIKQCDQEAKTARLQADN